MLLKVHGKATESLLENLNQFPDFTIKCRLPEILKDRGMNLTELSALTGIRVSALSEFCNMKRSTISLSHLIVIAKVLRLTDISSLIEFEMSSETAERFEDDLRTIEDRGLLPEQEKVLNESRNKKKPTAI
ncbi:helix-turn-helix domain-containing protein [Bacillus licheniformis]|uniref:helix-turn-helix domain-containing protein n=1 Tax=Bacillus licheniformis TaxID=1402 RepID=UPI0011A6BC1E|nr:helix-turn-helix transcriptional regulator [Bacillus licheniformis]